MPALIPACFASLALSYSLIHMSAIVHLMLVLLHYARALCVVDVCIIFCGVLLGTERHGRFVSGSLRFRL